MSDSFLISDLDRRVKNIIRTGQVEELNLVESKVRVRFKENHLSGWLSLTTLRLGSFEVWIPPTKGMRCLVLSEDGNLSRGRVVADIFAADMKAPGTETLRISVDGTKALEIDQQRNVSINCESISIKKGGVDLISKLIEGLNIISSSQTQTQIGPQFSQENYTQLPKVIEQIKKFGGKS